MHPPTLINSDVQFTFRHLYVLYLLSVCFTDLCAKFQPFIEAAEGADFPKLDPNPVGVANVKVAYNLVLLTGIPMVRMTCTRHAASGSDGQTKNLTFCVYR